MVLTALKKKKKKEEEKKSMVASLKLKAKQYTVL